MVAALIASVQAMAQTAFATLVHGETLSSFTGADALKQAMDAAADGDIITLSTGTFDGCKITKAITLRGAGMEADELGRQTKISGTITVSDPKKDMTIEGLLISGNLVFSTISINVYLNKCIINSVDLKKNQYGGTRGFIITNCLIKTMDQTYSGTIDLNTYNSYYERVEGQSRFRFDNCIIQNNPNGAYLSGTYYNCIYFGNKKPNGSTDHCVTTFAIDADHGSNNYQVEDITTLFNNYDANAAWYTRDLTLTDEAKAKYLGSDGTEVGIYGGSLPFSPWLDRPFIKKLTVAPKSTRDGKLSVDIEVGDAE